MIALRVSKPDGSCSHFGWEIWHMDTWRRRSGAFRLHASGEPGALVRMLAATPVVRRADGVSVAVHRNPAPHRPGKGGKARTGAVRLAYSSNETADRLAPPYTKTIRPNRPWIAVRIDLCNESLPLLVGLHFGSAVIRTRSYRCIRWRRL